MGKYYINQYIKNIAKQNSKSNSEDDIQEVEGNSKKLFTINDTPSNVLIIYSSDETKLIISIDEFIDIMNDPDNDKPDRGIFLYDNDNTINDGYRKNVSYFSYNSGFTISSNSDNENMSRLDNNGNIELYDQDFDDNQDKYYYCYPLALEESGEIEVGE